MRIVIATGIYPPQIGGPATYSKLLHDALPKYGIEVSVVNFGEVLKLPVFIRHIVYGVRLYRASRGASLIYALDPVSVGLPTALVALARRVPFVVKIVGDYAWEQGVQRFGVTDDIDTFSKKQKGYGLAVSFLKFIERWVATRAQRIIVPSQYLRGVVSHWGVDKKKIDVIFNAFEGFPRKGNRQALRALLSFHGNLIVSAGRLVPWKGFDGLIDIMPGLLKKMPNTKLVIIGGGSLQKVLQKRIDNLGLSSQIILTGALEQDVLHGYIRAADVFALNTSYEGFSHLLLEVMALDIPIVTTDIGGNPELITNGKDGILVGYNKKRILAKAIITLLTDQSLRRKLIAAGRHRISVFNEDRMLSSTVDIFKEIEHGT